MAPPMTSSQFIKALRDEGLVVHEVGDWREHNRNNQGPWGPVHGVMIHHTVTQGTTRTVDICRRGYPGLPGPLCHGVIDKKGEIHLVGYGRTNHAGLGDDNVLRAVIEGKKLPPDNERNTDGNRHFYGFECENLGDGIDPWPAAQLTAIEKVSAAICRHHGWDERSVIGHLEWQPGKIDPRGITMANMRTRVANRLNVKSTAPADRPKPAPPTKPASSTSSKAPARKKVSLSRLRKAAETDPQKKGQPVTYSGVRTVEDALVKEGLLNRAYADGHFGLTTITAYAAWQRRRGYSGKGADGIPGRTTLDALAVKHNFTVAD